MTDQLPPRNHNQPPSMIETATETMRDLSDWMKENPVVQTEDQAREAKVYLDRGKLCLKDLDDERDGKVRPLNEKVKEINAEYKAPKESLSTVIDTLRVRLAKFIAAERKKREQIARDAARIVQEAEQRAREAERVEQDAIASADSGELGVDIASHVQAADEAFKNFESAARKAALAERETHVKIGGGFSRAVSLRQKETLICVDAVAALNEIGATPDIREAIIKASRVYRKLHGKLPSGVEAEFTEEI